MPATLCLTFQPWVELGDLGSNWVYIGGRGRGCRLKGSAEGCKIAGIAVIARNRRNRKPKNLPLMNADERIAMGMVAETHTKLCASTRKPGVAGARWDAMG